MNILRKGSRGASVELLQLALKRADFVPISIDGIFGDETEAQLINFQKSRKIRADGIVGRETQHALYPWYTGYILHRVSKDETFSQLSSLYGSSLQSIITANPQFSGERLKIGSLVTVPLPFPVVPENISCSSRLVSFCVRGLKARYPFLFSGEIGKSVMGKPLWSLMLGKGDNKVLYSAAIHANEWITSLILLKFAEELADSYSNGGSIYGVSAADILSYATICLIPMLDPDGADLVTGDLSGGEFYNIAKEISRDYPQYPFPSGWKANIRGIDLNLQFPALWEKAREVKFSQGIRSPSPADFVGTSPLSAPESRALYDFTLSFDPSLILAYHTQGEVIYWKFSDFQPAGSLKIAEVFSRASGYALEETPYASSFAGYKDWFIKSFDRPGYTVEAGLGQNPLPVSDFPQIYNNNVSILTLASLLC